ncbi:hypothetical protein G8C92_11285 [Paenibacillus donghaensis]|uniref:hypothetical protein n=1 Tax=Paenibacillus donghaensis TaxID=414771 RepID=UPI00188389E7|nr:hypothetical protein [Paenibacillus donghaensis]MBE9914615.1 hypothetical protein [Paenibacillus donghaensis]
MTLGKITLTNDEINEYNRLKQKIRNARTRLEIALYTKQAEEILENGRLRYINKLENNNKPQIKSIQDRNKLKPGKVKLSGYAAVNHSYNLPHHIKRPGIITKLVKSNSGR